MKAGNLKEQTDIPDQTFPINIFFTNNIHLHWHEHIEWVFVKEGKCRVQIDASYVQLQKGDLAFVNTKQLHGATALEKNTALVCIVFNDALIRGNGLESTDYHYFLPYLNQNIKWPSTIKKDDPYMYEIGETFIRLVTEFENKKPGYELFIKAEIHQMFGLYFRYALQFSEQSVCQSQNNHDFSHLLQVLRERYQEHFSMVEAARMVNLSANHFCRTFKQVTGKTFIQYIHLLRMNEAERMLMETNDSVTGIANNVGFCDINYFGRLFKRIKGKTPTSIRKQS